MSIREEITCQAMLLMREHDQLGYEAADLFRRHKIEQRLLFLAEELKLSEVEEHNGFKS